MSDRYAVFGNPISHSRSPEIHSLFAEQTGQDVIYERQEVPLGTFDQAAKAFLDGGARGMNVTVPFKLDAYDFADSLTERARRAGAVNTLARSAEGIVLGDNTDGAGMVRDIVDNLGWAIANKSVLILGAGGAVRGVLEPLLAQRPASVIIANRTVAKARELAEHFSDLGAVEAFSFEALEGRRFDLIINGTSASLGGDLPPLPDNIVTPETCCYDMMYAKGPTVFMVWAASAGAAAVSDGLGMLVEQAAESFYLWRGVRPATNDVILHMRNSL